MSESVYPKEIDKGSYIIKRKEFTGGKAGFFFYVPEFREGANEGETDEIKAKNEAEVEASFQTITEKYSKRAIVLIVNNRLDAIIRAKASNKLPIYKDDDEKQQQEWQKQLQNDPCLIDPDRADVVQPGERELTIQGMMRQVNEYMKKNDAVSALALMEKVKKEIAKSLGGEASQEETN